jgi:hypothetical protein
MTEEGFKYRLIFLNRVMYMYGQKKCNKKNLWSRSAKACFFYFTKLIIHCA